MKTQDHGKEIMVLLVPKPLQEYMLHESHTSLGHNSKTTLYQFLKR